MAYEHLWSSHFVKLSIPIYGKITTFDCDCRIAEVIEVLNKKGYYTGNCCEGHPYKKPSSKGDTVAYFDGGYICFCDVKDAELFLSKLNEKCDYFAIYLRPKHLNSSVYWQPFKSIDIEGKSNTIMEYGFLVKLIRNIYEDIWRILLDVAKEIPYKEGYNEY